MAIEILDINTLTEEEFINGLKKNQREASKMRREIEKLKTAQLEQIANEIKSPVIKEKTEEEQIVDMIQEDDNENVFQDTVDYYYQDLAKIKVSDNIYQDIKDILPSKKNYDYNKILIELKIRLSKEIKEYSDFIHSERMNIDKSDLSNFKEEINLNQDKIKIITEIQKEKDQDNIIEEQIENNLIFTLTSGGNVRAIDEIEHIDFAYYEKFKGLFASIKDGTFKNVKRFVRNNNLTAGVCEVKDHKVRVVFDRLSKKDYAIIAVFIKKSDNDKGYKEQLISKINEYRLQRDNLVEQLNNPEFRKINKLYEQELYNKLNNSEYENPKIFVKEGDFLE